jgi:hypothetical protein
MDIFGWPPPSTGPCRRNDGAISRQVAIFGLPKAKECTFVKACTLIESTRGPPEPEGKPSSWVPGVGGVSTSAYATRRRIPSDAFSIRAAKRETVNPVILPLADGFLLADQTGCPHCRPTGKDQLDRLWCHRRQMPPGTTAKCNECATEWTWHFDPTLD